MWNKFRQIGKSRRLQGPHVVEGQTANLLRGPFRKEWHNRPKVDVRKPLFPKNKGHRMLDTFAMEQLNKNFLSIHIILSFIDFLPYEVEYAVGNLRM